MKIRRSAKFCAPLLVLFFGIWPSVIFADTIHLKNGKSYEGKLIIRTEKRYLFAMDLGTERIAMSFFPEEVEKVDLDKETVESIPYLKEVESVKLGGKKDSRQVYELSLFREGQTKVDLSPFGDEELRRSLSEEQMQYYGDFSFILVKYADKFSKIQDIYIDLTAAKQEDFTAAKGYMDNLYFELINLPVPDIFRESHRLYLESVKASSLTFKALDQNMLDEASRQLERSENLKEEALKMFRGVVQERLSGSGSR